MEQDRISPWLERLGSAAPTPGGGAAAALAAASAAALVEMVVNLTLDKAAYAQHTGHVRPLGERAAELRRAALGLAAADEAAFAAVMAAYRMPRDSDEARRARTAAIQAATVSAARPPLAVAELATEVVDLAAQLPGRSNPNVLSDVGVAASLACSALESAAVNVQVNLGALADSTIRQEFSGELAIRLRSLELGRRVVDDVMATLGWTDPAGGEDPTC